MNWLFALPGLLLLLAAFLFVAGRRSRDGGLFRQVLPQLLLLLPLSAAVSLFSSAWLKNFPYSPRLLFFLWLLFWFFLVVLAVKALAYFVFDYLVLGKQGVHYPKLIKDVVVFILFVVGILLIARYYLKQDLTVLLASSAVLTVVVGFALQDVLGNLFSGIILNFEDSFKLGDWVRIGEREGRVEQFGWRSFKIRSIDRELIVIPNQTASKADVLIYGGGGQPVILKIRVGAGYGDSPDRVADAILKALATMADLRADPPPVVQLVGFGDFALEYEVKFWIDDYGRHNILASEARRRIWYAFRREGIEIPFPKRDVYLKRERKEAIAPEALAAALKRNEVLAAIGEEDFRNLLAAAEPRVYGGGETVIREGDAGDHLYHIVSGAMGVFKEGRSVAHLGAGDFFGEISLVTGEKTNATVTAERESVVIRVSSARFKQVVDMNEAMAEKLSAVIVRRQEEMRAFSEKNLLLDHGVLKKDSENLFKRILKYFASKK
ncbi:MAG: mechanosensitive ion channel [Acidobacteria bacterium]|jgi:small-conductance mechanosensitive channel|nr:mechanosensitive ion channel [Acidobacteriota bacterium]